MFCCRKMVSLCSRRPGRPSPGAVCLSYRKILWRFNNLRPRLRFHRANRCARESGGNGILHQREGKGGLAVSVCCRCFLRFSALGVDFQGRQSRRRAADVGGALRSIPHQKVDNGGAGRSRADVRGASGRRVTERSRTERSGSAGCEWLRFPDLLFCGRNDYGQDYLWRR